jgi:hypothetical protein
MKTAHAKRLGVADVVKPGRDSHALRHQPGFQEILGQPAHRLHVRPAITERRQLLGREPASRGDTPHPNIFLHCRNAQWFAVVDPSSSRQIRAFSCILLAWVIGT